MSSMNTWLHINAVALGNSRRICAIWKVSDPAGQGQACEFGFALLLPRNGAEQDWAAETALGALKEQRLGNGPVCVDLTTTVDGIAVGALRPGLCGADLLEVSREALGEGHQEWAELAHGDPSAFHSVASDGYVLLRHAAIVAGRDPTGPGGRVRIVHVREHRVLGAYVAALLSNAGVDSEPSGGRGARSDTTPDPDPQPHRATAELPHRPCSSSWLAFLNGPTSSFSCVSTLVNGALPSAVNGWLTAS